MLPLGRSQSATTAWDCTTYPFPVQIIKGSTDTNYRTMQLNLGAGTFQEMWQWTVDTDAQPGKNMNARSNRELQ